MQGVPLAFFNFVLAQKFLFEFSSYDWNLSRGTKRDYNVAGSFIIWLNALKLQMKNAIFAEWGWQACVTEQDTGMEQTHGFYGRNDSNGFGRFWKGLEKPWKVIFFYRFERQPRISFVFYFSYNKSLNTSKQDIQTDKTDIFNKCNFQVTVERGLLLRLRVLAK